MRPRSNCATNSPERSRICHWRTRRPVSCMRAVMPYGAIISSVGGWNVPARRSWVGAGSLSSTTTGMPWRASASAHISPVGPAPATTTGSAGTTGARDLLDQLGAGQLLEIPVVDVLELVLRQVRIVQNAQRLADVHRALLGIERAVGREHDVLVRIEGEPQRGPCFGGECGGVDDEVLLEIVERSLLQAALERLVVGVRGACADLVPAWTDAALDHRHDAAEVVHDRLEPGIVVDRLGKDEAGHRGRG